MTSEIPRWVRHCAVAAVVMVATVAAVVSYAHMHEVAARAGEGWRSWLLPLSVDGLIVCASLVLIVRRRRGQPAGWLAWCGLALGLAVSVCANIAAAEPTLVGRLVAAWSPLALGVAYELLLGLLRPAPQGVAAPGMAASTIGAVGATGAVGTVRTTHAPALTAATTEPIAVDLVARARAVVAAGAADGRPVGRGRLATALGIGQHEARRLLDRIREDSTSAEAA